MRFSVQRRFSGMPWLTHILLNNVLNDFTAEEDISFTCPCNYNESCFLEKYVLQPPELHRTFGFLIACSYSFVDTTILPYSFIHPSVLRSIQDYYILISIVASRRLHHSSSTFENTKDATSRHIQNIIIIFHLLVSPFTPSSRLLRLI